MAKAIKSLTVGCALAPFLAVSSHAQTSYASFSDADGTSFTSNTIPTNELGWDSAAFFTNSESTGDPVTFSSGSLAYTDSNSNSLVTAGNRIVYDIGDDTTGDNDNTFPRIRPTDDRAGQSFWISALLQSDGALISLRMRDLGNNQNIRVNLQDGLQPDIVTDGQNAPSFGGTITAGQTYFVVANYRSIAGPNNDEFEVWINPDIGGASPTNAFANATVTLTAGGGDLGEINEIRPLSNMGIGAGPGVVAQFDELRVGTSFDSVSPIPEPASVGAVLGGCALVLTALRRRRG